MKKYLLITVILLSINNLHARSYISYYLIHVGIDNQLKEKDRQKKIKENEVKVLGLETQNKKDTEVFKTKYAKIKSRLNSLSFLFDAVMITPGAIPAIKGTLKNQEEIFKEVKDAPYLIPVSLEAEKEFVDKLQMILRFITGLSLSYGDINQMKAGDRKMLLNHAIDEINALYGLSGNLLDVIRNIKSSIALDKERWKTWVNREKDLVTDIIKNSKDL